MPVLIRHENERDHALIREVNHLAFGGDEEARLVDALRDGGYVRLSLVAQRTGKSVSQSASAALTSSSSNSP